VAKDLPGIPRRNLPSRPDLEVTPEPPQPPRPRGYRKISPPPIEEPVSARDLGEKTAELGDAQEALEAEHEARLRAEARVAKLEKAERERVAESAPQRQPEPSPKVEAEAIIITRRGFSFPWGMAPWVIASLAGGWAAKTHVDQGSPATKEVTATAAVAASEADKANAASSTNATRTATVETECRENVAYVIDVIETLRPGLEVVRPANVPGAREMIVDGKSKDAAAPLRPGGPITIDRKPSPTAQPFTR